MFVKQERSPFALSVVWPQPELQPVLKAGPQAGPQEGPHRWAEEGAWVEALPWGAAGPAVAAAGPADRPWGPGQRREAGPQKASLGELQRRGHLVGVKLQL